MSARPGAARRLAVAVAVLMVVDIAAAAPASAHTVGGVSPTDYQSRIIGLSPPAATIAARLLDLGRRIQLTNTGATDVIVVGYQGEDYLRIGPGGVFENLHSPAVYQNRPLPPGVTAPTLPPIAQATAPAEWHKITSGHTATWRDRRTRWEGPRPATVQANPDRQTIATQWVIPLRQGHTTLHLEGVIVWVPPPNPLPWLALAALLLALTITVGVSRWGATSLAVLLAVLVATDIVRGYAVALISGGPLWVRLVRTLFVGEFGFAFWALGAWAVALLQTEREGGLLAGIFAGFGIGLLSGLTDLPYLLHSQPPAAAPATIARTGVAIAIGFGLGVAVACVVRLRRKPIHTCSPPAPSPDPRFKSKMSPA